MSRCTGELRQVAPHVLLCQRSGGLGVTWHYHARISGGVCDHRHWTERDAVACYVAHEEAPR
jgi:hypothetical protein